jgi:hypothetical protein
MKRKDVVAQAQAIKAGIAEKEERATDLDVIVAEIMKLPYGQLKKVLTEPVLEVLKKYGYTE